MSAALTLARAVSLAACLGGAALVAQGGSVPVRAEVAQVALERKFDRDVAEHRAARQVPAAGRADSRAPANVMSAAPRALAPAAAPGAPLARIAVERLGVRQVVLAGGTSHEELAKGPTVVKQGDAASPVTVLAAHRDTHFAFIRDLREGDEVTLERVDGQVERYRVVRFQTVRWDEFSYPLDPARPLLALTTCYPFGGTEYGGPWRRVAWAQAANPGPSR